LLLYALHIHHGLSTNADAWLQHCSEQASRLGVPFHAAQVKVNSSDRRGVEEAARLARYSQLGIMCRQAGATILLTGQHQDDQAETVLLQMVRGAGVAGLSGMPVLQQDGALLGDGVALARPLLGVARTALEHAARQRHLDYVSDESNLDLRYRRNGVRHILFPVMQSEFPGFPSRLARVAAHMQAAQCLLDELAQADLAACAADRQGERLDLAALKRLSTERTGNLLRYWLYRRGVGLPSTARLEEIRWQMFEAGADSHPCFDFGIVQLRRVGNYLEIHPAVAAVSHPTIVLRWHGQHAIDVPEWNGCLLFESTAGAGLAPGRLRAGALTIRPRSGSERLQPALNRPSKNLKQLFQERAVPSWQRPSLPLLYLDQQLVFVGGLGMNMRAELVSPGIAIRWRPSTALQLDRE
jgi:tRNA(Ile)-lysidine synthase